MLRWVSPFTGTIRITGELDRDSPKGNGVRGLIISSRQGVLKDVPVPAGKDPGLIHIMVEVDTLDAVGQALDRVMRDVLPLTGMRGL